MTQTPRAVDTRRTLGRRIAVERLARNLTQYDIARHIGTRQSVVSMVETAGREPLLGTLIDVAGTVGLEVALVGDYHLPLLDLTADELDALIHAAGSIAAIQAGPPLLRSALDKLTTTEETPTDG